MPAIAALDRTPPPCRQAWRTLMGMLLACWMACGLAEHPATLAAADPPDAGQAVTITDDAATATIGNGVVTLTVRKRDGNLLALRYAGLDLLSGGGGYWNIYGNLPGQPPGQEKGQPALYAVTVDPARNGGAMGEIALRFPYPGHGPAEPLDIEIRYTLHRHDSGIYAWTIADHPASYPAFTIIVSTVCLKLNPDVFDFLSADRQRQRQMPTPLDWVTGTQLNLWEARRLNQGIHAGEVEHKYDYSIMFSRTPAWGWSSTTRQVGLYDVNPSIEYINGSPTMVDIAGHLDVKASLPADPTLLFIWHVPHYGGRGIVIQAGEPWHKVVGPFLLYCTSGPTPQSMYEDALARAAREQQAWPYAWAHAPGYASAAERGSASGTLVVRDPQDPSANAAHAWIGLAAPPYQVTFDISHKHGPVQTGPPVTIDWQTDGKHYEYWTQADAQGRFTIPHARPGDYVLYAFQDGVLGGFSQPGVRIQAGATTALGDLTWVPLRYGRQLWDIGIPNRSAEEFRHGDHYWQWGLYNLFGSEFPHGMDYVIGRSSYRTDWNYAQPPEADGHGGYGDSTWRIHFTLPHPLNGTATLRLAICGARGGPVDVAVNGTAIGSSGPLPESGVMHRDGIRSATLTEVDLHFPASLMVAGENVVTLTKHAKAWTDGVLYDYLRLEVADP